MKRHQRYRERGTLLLVVVFIATAIAALAAISSGRVVAETRQQRVLEAESRALNDAFAKVHLAMNVVNNSAYNNANENLELQDSINGVHGGTAGGETDPSGPWLQDPSGVVHGHIKGTDVRVYRGSEYVRRLAKLKGKTDPGTVDAAGDSKSYFVLEAAGRADDTVRLISALVRENEPFSSFVFFQNRHTLGVSGSPRGLIHSNDQIAFYFPDGNYVDAVSAVNGFGYEAGATTDNTAVANGNDSATEITIDDADFDDLRTKANLFDGTDGLDAEIRMYDDGRVRIRQYTKPHFEDVEYTYSEEVVVGYNEVTTTETQQVQVGSHMEDRERQIVTGYETVTYQVEVIDYEWQDVEVTTQVPVTEMQTVTCTRWVQVFVPYDDGSGGTAVGGGGEGVPGEYVWQQEEYSCEQEVIVGYTPVTTTESQQVAVGSHMEDRTREDPIYGTETYQVEVPDYEDQEVQVTTQEPITETNTWTETHETYIPPSLVDETIFDLDDTGAGTIFIEGRITRLYGELKGRLSIVGNEKVRIYRDIQYVDDDGDTAMINGKDYTQPYERNPDYEGDSVLGVIARDDVTYTRHMNSQSEVNATLMSTTGRVGIDGFAIDENGEPVKDPYYGMTPEERKQQEAYDRSAYPDRRFRKDSLRRIGGIISNDRILETYIRARSDGTSYVDSGFKRGNSKFDINLLFNPPPNFVEVPRPVLTYFAPILFVRGEE